MGGWMGRWMDGCMHERMMDRLMDRWLEGEKDEQIGKKRQGEGLSCIEEGASKGRKE
jgi:hypothetical protein